MKRKKDRLFGIDITFYANPTKETSEDHDNNSKIQIDNTTSQLRSRIVLNDP